MKPENRIDTITIATSLWDRDKISNMGKQFNVRLNKGRVIIRKKQSELETILEEPEFANVKEAGGTAASIKPTKEAVQVHYERLEQTRKKKCHLITIELPLLKISAEPVACAYRGLVRLKLDDRDESTTRVSRKPHVSRAMTP